MYFSLIDKKSEEITKNNTFTLALGHGDFCFSNILYDPNTQNFKLIDPRGGSSIEELFDDPLYDIAKLSHSVLGNYDWINSLLFNIKINPSLGLSIDYDFEFNNIDPYKVKFISRLKEYGYSIKDIRLLEASLFLSMLPLHIDYPNKILGFLLNALEILEEVKKSDAASSFITQECNKLKISHFCIIELDGPTNGQATTVMHGLSECLPDEPLGIYNIDTYVEPYQLSLPSEKDFGFIPCFTPSGDHWSFVKTQPNGDVTQITEKIRISDFATLGLYWFKNPQLYKECYNTYYGASQSNFVKGEAYIAPLYNELLAKGLKVGIEIIGNEFVHAIGTPSELLAFEEGLG